MQGQGATDFPRHVPCHILGGNVRSCSQAPSSDVSYHESAHKQICVQAHAAIFTTATVSPTSESPANASGSANHHKFPAFHPFNGTQEDYAALLQMSSTFSSVVVSNLLQNPAAHAAANFDASFWPAQTWRLQLIHIMVNTLLEDSHQELSTKLQAWLPLLQLQLLLPQHGGRPRGFFLCVLLFMVVLTALLQQMPLLLLKILVILNRKAEQSKGKEMNNKIHNSGSKSPTTSSLDSGDELGPKVNNVLTTEHEKNLAVADPKDSNMSKNRKRVDRSSCGSNSSNDLETAELKKHDKTKEETKEADASQTTTESSSRRSKNPSSSNDSRKEERMAFRALFLREVLPQSFSPPYDGKNKAAEQQHTKKTDVEENMPNVEVSNENASQLDLNSNTIEIESWSNHHDTVNRLAEDKNVKEGLLTIGLAQRTCFKPYKRCCVEARESGVPNTSCQDLEKTPNAYAWERKLQAKN